MALYGKLIATSKPLDALTLITKKGIDMMLGTGIDMKKTVEKAVVDIAVLTTELADTSNMSVAMREAKKSMVKVLYKVKRIGFINRSCWWIVALINIAVINTIITFIHYSNGLREITATMLIVLAIALFFSNLFLSRVLKEWVIGRNESLTLILNKNIKTINELGREEGRTN